MHSDVFISLRRIMRATDLHSKQLVKQTGLTTPQILLLRCLYQAGATPVTVLAQQMNLSQATVTTIVDRLEKRLMVERARSQSDKRVVLVSLTPLGQQTVQQAPIPIQQHFVEQFEKLPSWEQHLMVASLQRLAAMMESDVVALEPALAAEPIEGFV